MESKIPYEKQTDTDPPPQYEPPTAPAAMDTTAEPSERRVIYLRTIPGPIFGPKGVRTICPSCQSSIVSDIKYECNSRTHMNAFLLGVIACCCFVPYMMKSCKSANHMCPNCDAFLGSYIN